MDPCWCLVYYCEGDGLSQSCEECETGRVKVNVRIPFSKEMGRGFFFRFLVFLSFSFLFYFFFFFILDDVKGAIIKTNFYLIF